MKYHITWRLGVLASAVALLASFSHLPAQALGLGRITVQSALGEVLKAEVEVPEITPDEAASLRVAVAAPAAFKAAGLEYSPSVSGVQVSLQKRANGRSFLSLTSARPMTEPFVDLIIEASWASGRLVRDYTMLFDPPNLRQSGQSVPTAPSVATAPVAPATSRPSTNNTPMMPPASTSRTDLPPAVRAVPQKPTATPRAGAAANAEAPLKPFAAGQQVTVKAGDTASKIASQIKPASISLDQMLVALLKSNADAFIAGNVNRLKSGAVLNIPAAEDAAATSGEEASRNIVAQARDFNEFRQKLASGVPTTQVQSANRQSGGKIQANVQDRAAAAVAPDKLTLSKGALVGAGAAEEKIAKDKQAKDASTRMAELSKNIGELNKAAGAANTAVAPVLPASSSKAVGLPVDKPLAIALPASAAAPASGVPSAAVAASAVKAASAPAAAAAAQPATAVVLPSAAVAASAALPLTSSVAVLSPDNATATATATQTSVVSSVPVASAPAIAAKPVVATAPPPPEPGFIEALTDSPFVLPGLAALLALLAGIGFYRYKKRDQGAALDSSFLESRLQPDSFFGASGGQRIDTNESGSGAGSSMVYSPSQLDAAGDVDPVAEADVYLAYGRDLQAEEILKEALRTHPTRVAIHAKLLEIYAKRRDLKGFESVAGEAFSLTRGTGSEWAYICEMARDIDPSNPLYREGGQPQQATASAAALTPAVAASYGADTIPLMTVASSSDRDISSDVDFDLDLDFSDGPAYPVADTKASDAALKSTSVKPSPDSALEPTAAALDTKGPAFAAVDMDFDPATPAYAASKTQDENILGFDFDLPLMDTKSAAIAPAAAASTPMLPTVDKGMLEFDLGSLSLDLDVPATTASKAVETAPDGVEGPLDIKFALAEEFRTLGDNDGARSLASEVVAQAQGALKTKAQAFLNALS